MAKRTRSQTDINQQLRLDILDPSKGGGSEAAADGPSSLQQSARTMILQSVGLKYLGRIAELPLPKPMINMLSNQLAVDDFFVNRNDLDGDHRNYCVYPAKCLLDMSDVLLKCVPECLASEEVNAAVEQWIGVAHPNLMSYYIKFAQSGTQIVVFEYPPFALPDILDKLRRDNKRIPEFLIWKAFHELCSVLKYLHDQGMSYTGLKPERVAFTQEGVLKLDSGLLYLPSPGQDMMQGAAVGDSGVTGVYTSPETLKGEEITVKNQVWILGCLLYEMAAREPAYANEGTDMFGAMANIMEGKIPTSLEGGYSEDMLLTVRDCLHSEAHARPTLEDLQARSNAKMEALVQTYAGENITSL
ncbi:serine/threonine-protein kinase Nek7-like [Nematostella vectensis]|uniref:serine/threonine-protein kinase Nek7-like n=1 Tax=Nematostella vectensis TaxID=45351 RepID=UPI0020772F02|nr:serine/threonine-protein kinase Nek7-like [Nematostella vectensis]